MRKNSPNPIDFSISLLMKLFMIMQITQVILSLSTRRADDDFEVTELYFSFLNPDTNTSNNFNLHLEDRSQDVGPWRYFLQLDMANLKRQLQLLPGLTLGDGIPLPQEIASHCAGLMQVFTGLGNNASTVLLSHLNSTLNNFCDRRDPSMPLGEIIGISVGISVAALCLLACLAAFSIEMYKDCKKERSNTATHPPYNEPAESSGHHNNQSPEDPPHDNASIELPEYHNNESVELPVYHPDSFFKAPQAATPAKTFSQRLADIGIEDNDEIILKNYLCPIAQTIMNDPVFISSGRTFDKTSLEKHFASGKTTDPITNLPLDNINLIPNIDLNSEIHAFVSKKEAEFKQRNSAENPKEEGDSSPRTSMS